MSLFGKKEKEEIEKLRQMIPAESFNLEEIKNQISNAKNELNELNDALEARKKVLFALKSKIIETREEVLVQSFGLYTPKYEFMNSDEYKAKLLEIRAAQADMIKNQKAVTGATDWRVDGDYKKGKKMIEDTQKLLLRAFNAECDSVIEKVKYNNVETAEKRITKSRDTISKLGNMMRISITPEFYALKIKELYLAFEYQRKKQEEKDAQKEARAQLREEQKLAKEIEAQRAKLEKEQTHYKNALKKINEQLAIADESEKTAIEEKKKEIESQLNSIDKSFEEVDYRAANQRAGYVYVISNIGAFGENVYKIGMTRRLNPMDRVDELGDASVPFDFDVHAMIFSEDAPGLEAALHNAFADRKLNCVNQRREFFNVTLEEIKKVVKENFDKSVEFIEVAPAEQYRESLIIRNAKNNT